MATPYSLGLEASIYALERQAAKIGDPTFIERAKELERKLKNMWVPAVEAPFIESDALALGKDMGDQSGDYILFNEEEGREVDPAHAAFLSGDISAGLSAAAEDIQASAIELGTAASSGAWGVEKLLFAVAAAAIALWLLMREIA
jgi:hypothetical protein